ncbi:MAG: anthranilate synthase component I [Pseudomonadota bacterium]
MALDFQAESNRESVDFRTAGGIEIARTTWAVPYEGAGEALIDQLDNRRGALFTSSFEYPGRYTRWDMGFVNPLLEISARGRKALVRALNDRGRVLLPAIIKAAERESAVRAVGQVDAATIDIHVAEPAGAFTEELRSKQPTIFSLIRALMAHFRIRGDSYLGLYGAFGYELAFQFDPIELQLTRDADQRDLVLYLPDELLLVDHRATRAYRCHYEFTVDGAKTHGLPREGTSVAFTPATNVGRGGDHQPGEYADCVRVAREHFRRGELFEVVPGQTFVEPCPAPPSEIFRRLRKRNPAPYGAFLNLGDQEYLVAASPEMYVRVEGKRVETCPISGTIVRGADAIEDAKNILTLLNSEKETSELTMCTDVDRNDKSRVCEPGSIKVIGRRQIEMYSRLIHTVDHVEGQLREGYDALDAFLAHTWAVTVTGAPKRAAIQFIENHERSPRRWYGGAIGMVGFDGNMNTGLTLRTVRIANGVAEVRAGATLLFDSDPDAEEAETQLKASALLDAISRPDTPAPPVIHRGGPEPKRKVLMVDHQDSFVHTLAGYLRETGAEVITMRSGFERGVMEQAAADLVVLSPGPGRPSDFNLSETIGHALTLERPLFGVCLGLQGIVEYFGGELMTLGYPMHGKPSTVRQASGEGFSSAIFEGMPETFVAGRYHSLFADPAAFPAALRITARTEDGTIMALEHHDQPIAAVQFHPESILTLEGEVGRQLIHNVVLQLR